MLHKRGIYSLFLDYLKEGIIIKKLILEKYCRINLEHPIKYIDFDKYGSIYILYEVNSLNYKVEHFLDEKRYVSSFSLNEEIDYLQMIDDEFLFVSNNLEEGEPNAFLLNIEGKLLNSFYVGTGIQVCRVDDQERIWIGYSDEGIFEPDSIGEDGIVCFNKNGAVVYNDFHISVEKGVVPPIDHCNALTILNGEVWICYYSENYCLVQINKNNVVHFWGELDIVPVNGISVGEKCLLIITVEKLIYLNLITGSQLDTLPYDKNGNKIEIKQFFTSQNVIFAVTDEDVYLSKV